MKNHSQRKKSSPKIQSCKTKTAAPVAAQHLAARLEQELDKLPLDPLARASGFRRRQPKKLPPRLFVQAACLLVTLGSVSYRRWAGLIGILGGCTLAKQSLFERMSPRAVGFLQSVLGALLGSRAITPIAVRAALRGFGRVLVQDSTTLQLSEKLARFFPGASNQKGAQGGLLKIQACYDLLSQSFVAFSLSSYRRNDQAASPDVLPLVQAGDLVLRDLGYFVLEVFQQIALANAFFLSRLRVGVGLWEADGCTPVNLLRRLRSCPGHFEGQFFLGKEKLLVRVVAIRMPAPVAAERRRKARQNRDRRSRPSPQRLALLGWAIFITNVPATRLSAKAVAQVYGLRWRIETIFKVWKTYFALTEVPGGSQSQVEALIYAKLIFITLFQVCFWQRWWVGKDAQGRPALSLLKVAQAAESYLLVLVLSHLGVDLTLAWEQLLDTHCRYERRRRPHFMQEDQGKGSAVLRSKRR
jgi:hypothetical protein